MGTLLRLENTGEQDLALVAPKQKKKPNCPPESDKNQKDIQLFCATAPLKSTKKPETKKPKSANVIIIHWILDSSILFVFFFTFFSKESIIINIKRNLCFALQTKTSVKKINSGKANFDFFIWKKFFRHGFNLAQRENYWIWRGFNLAIFAILRQLRQIFSLPKFIRIR